MPVLESEYKPPFWAKKSFVSTVFSGLVRQVRENGFTLEPGFYGHELVDLGASKVQFFGKPYSEVYQLLTKSLSEVPGNKIVMCGDSLHTDILGAASQGWKTVLVTKDGLFSGFDTKSYSKESGIFPNWRLERLHS